MPKPHRVLLDRVSGYADEAAAFCAAGGTPAGRSPASTTRAGAAATTPPTPSRAPAVPRRRTR